MSLKIEKYQEKVDDLNDMIALESKASLMKRQKASSAKSATTPLTARQRVMMKKRDKLLQRMQVYQLSMGSMTMEINQELHGTYFHSS